MMLLLVTFHIGMGEPPPQPGGLPSASNEVGTTDSLAPRGLEDQEDWRLARPGLRNGPSSVHWRLLFPQGRFLQLCHAPRIELLEQALITYLG